MKHLDLNQTELNSKLVDAVKQKDCMKVYELLQSKADPKTLDEQGIPIVYTTFENDDVMSMELLIIYGAYIDYDQMVDGVSSDNYETKIISFIVSAIASDCHIVTKFMCTNQLGDGIKSKIGNLFFNIACGSGSNDAVRVLAKMGVKVNSKDNNGNIALLEAAKFQKLDTIDILLQNGANVNIQDSKGRTALHISAESGCLDSVVHLVNAGANIQQLDNSGKSALNVAKENNYNNIVRYINFKNRPIKIGNIIGKMR